MKAMILTFSTALALTLATPAAEAGSWTTKWTGPRGGVYEGNGSCLNGACKASGTFTGPNGGVWHHDSNAHRVEQGQWAGEHTITGPGGRTWQNSWTWRTQDN
jgi:hypothetical protein